jgi:hypothetical protein
MLILVNIDLINFSKKNRQEHAFEMELSYREFDNIFVRTCINFIKKYIQRY